MWSTSTHLRPAWANTRLLLRPLNGTSDVIWTSLFLEEDLSPVLSDRLTELNVTQQTLPQLEIQTGSLDYSVEGGLKTYRWDDGTDDNASHVSSKKPGYAEVTIYLKETGRI